MKTNSKRLFLLLMLLSLGLSNIIFATKRDETFYVGDYQFEAYPNGTSDVVQRDDGLEGITGLQFLNHYNSVAFLTKEKYNLKGKRVDMAFTIYTPRSSRGQVDCYTQLGRYHKPKYLSLNKPKKDALQISNGSTIYTTYLVHDSNVEQYICKNNYYGNNNAELLYSDNVTMSKDMYDDFFDQQYPRFKIGNHDGTRANLIAREFYIHEFDDVPQTAKYQPVPLPEDAKPAEEEPKHPEPTHPEPENEDYYIGDYKVNGDHSDGNLTQANNLVMEGSYLDVRTEEKFNLLGKRVDIAFSLEGATDKFIRYFNQFGNAFYGHVMTIKQDDQEYKHTRINSGEMVYYSILFHDDKIIEQLSYGNYFDKDNSRGIIKWETQMLPETKTQLSQAQDIRFMVDTMDNTVFAKVIAKELTISDIAIANDNPHPHLVQKDYYIDGYKVYQINDTDGELVQDGDNLYMYGGEWTNAHLVNGRRDGNWVRTEDEFYLLNKRIDTAYQIISEKYTAFGTRFGDIYAGKTTTTHHSWSGTLVIPNNTTIFHSELVTKDGIKEYLCTGNYYGQSGAEIIYENETPMTSKLLKKFKEPQPIDFRTWDNYGNENAILIAKAIEISNYKKPVQQVPQTQQVKQTHQDYPQPTADHAVEINIDSHQAIKVFNGVAGVTIFYNQSGDDLGYRVYRSEKESELGISVTDFYITADKFTDVNVEPNTTYYYTIKSVLEEANPLAGKREVLGSSLTKWTIKTPKAEYSIFSTDTAGKTRNFIMLKIDDAIMSVNGLSQEVDPGRGTAPIIVKGRTMVPIRAIVEAMSGNVGWEGSEQKVTLSANSNEVGMWINQKRLLKNGTESKVDVPPSIMNGRTFVPLRFGAENLNCQVDWINSQKAIVIVWFE